MKILKSLMFFKKKLTQKIKLFWYVLVKDTCVVFIENGKKSYAHVPKRIRPMEEFLDNCINTIEWIEIEQRYKKYQNDKP